MIKSILLAAALFINGSNSLPYDDDVVIPENDFQVSFGISSNDVNNLELLGQKLGMGLDEINEKVLPDLIANQVLAK
ncbi:MAG: hypothetical protein AAF770_00085 [Bacteroidota bacterium]